MTHIYKRVACDCNPEGSATQQCNQTTGHCKCKLGIGGEKCDTCARGFLGTAPNCNACGECFENWDNTQKLLSGKLIIFLVLCILFLQYFIHL